MGRSLTQSGPDRRSTDKGRELGSLISVGLSNYIGHAFYEHVHVVGLYQEISASYLKGRVTVGLTCEACVEIDRNLRIVLAKLLAHFKTVCARRLCIQDVNIKRPFVRQLYSCFAAHHRFDN